MKSVFKILLASIVLVLGVASVSYLQNRFDRSDLKNALQAVQLSRPQGKEGPTVLELIESHLGVPAKDVIWVPHFKSKFQGLVLVEAHYDAQKKPLEWEVDVVRFEVHPVTEETKSLGLLDHK